MYYPNYYPYYTYPQHNYINNLSNSTNSSSKVNDKNTQKKEKDIVKDTIPFENFCNSNSNNLNNNNGKSNNSSLFSFNKNEIRFGNITLQIDDLIIIGIIILLFMESEDNFLLIAILGLLLLNINLTDIFSIF